MGSLLASYTTENNCRLPASQPIHQTTSESEEKAEQSETRVFVIDNQLDPCRRLAPKFTATIAALLRRV